MKSGQWFNIFKLIDLYATYASILILRLIVFEALTVYQQD